MDSEIVVGWDTPVEEIRKAERAGRGVSYPKGFSHPLEVWRKEAARQLAEAGFVVELRPGLALLDGPDGETTVEFEYQWERGEGFTIRDVITVVRITGVIPDYLDLNPYFNAFALKMLSEPRAKTLRPPLARPQPGHPFDVDFYTRVIALHNRFRDEGRSDPSAAVADLMDERPETVRLWVHRGRQWFKRHEEDQ
ncbi:MAG: hypothetical protein ACR2LG_08660 [Actinomycetota bacterium]